MDRGAGPLRRAGLPEPELQHTVRDGDFVADLDLAWPKVMWAVECDSLAHGPMSGTASAAAG